MKLEDIMDEWRRDSGIDRTDLGEETVRIPNLLSKYMDLLAMERLLRRKLDLELRKLKLEKYEFLVQGHTDETRVRGWKLPAAGRVLKTDIPMYMDADDDVQGLVMRIGVQDEKIEFLESVVKSIHNRGWLVKNLIEWSRFVSGG
jgi:hypothetical protein